MKIKKICLNVGLMLLVLVIILLCMEILLRVSYPIYDNFNTEMWRYSVEIKKLSNTPGVSHEHMPNKESDLYGVKLKTNSIGFRDYEYNLTKAKNSKRILVLGDSVTLGWGVELENTYPKVLERMLNQYKKEKYEVMNSAVGNFNSEMEANILQKYLLLDLDAVIIGFFPNDAEKTVIVKPGLLYQLKKRLCIYPFFWDRFMKIKYMMSNKKGKSIIHEFYSEEYGGMQRIDSSFLKIKKISVENDLDVYVLIIPQFYDEFKNYDSLYIHEFVKGLCKKYDFKCVDALDNLKEFSLKDIIVSKEDAHPNVLGHKIIAESAFEVIKYE